MPDLSINELVSRVEDGRIRIPAFQRGFVWEPDRVAYLMDSLFQGYPIGSVLLWRTKNALRTERSLGPFQLAERDPDYPIDYVLDGQQRITSIFGVFQTEIEVEETPDWLPIYYDLAAEPDAQERQFVALPATEVDPVRHFPLATIRDSTAYRTATEPFEGDTLRQIDRMADRFKEVQLPTAVFETDDPATVAIVFERVNRLGVELDTFQLISAWTWSEEFDLKSEFEELAEELKPFGFAGVGEDINLLLRCCAAVVAGDAATTALVNLNGRVVREQFGVIKGGILGAVDFLKANLHVQKLENLPFPSVLVPLTVFFAAPDGTGVQVADPQRQAILRWFWRSAFSRRFSAGVLRNLKADIDAMGALRRDGHSDDLDRISATVDPSYFIGNNFNVRAVNTKVFVLMMAQKEPRTWVSGQPVGLAEVLRNYNRTEFHHVYPQKYLGDQGRNASEISPLANLVFMSAQDNKILGGVAPSKYQPRMTADRVSVILEHALCPANTFNDAYEEFLAERAKLLTSYAFELMGFDEGARTVPV